VLIIYLNTRSAAKTAIVLLAVPFSLVGAFWALYALGYNLSVAVWVGLIALAGLDAETGVVMLLYLDHAWEKFCAQGRMNTMTDLHDAVLEGAVQRIRPKVMTVCAILFGLLPIMWSPVTQAGADVMKRIATPMIGGVITSAILELLIYPVIFVLWRKRALPDSGRERGGPDAPPCGPSGAVRRRPPAAVKVGMAVVAAALLAAGGYYGWKRWQGNLPLMSPRPEQAVATQAVNGVTVQLLDRDGRLKTGDNALTLEFRDAGGQLVEAGDVKLDLQMNMPGMTMRSAARVEQKQPGEYRVQVKPDMAGEWTASLSSSGPAAKGDVTFPVTVNQ
jgi:hypothetical protein